MSTTDSALIPVVLREIGRSGVKFALLHGIERLQAGQVDSDVDIVVDRPPTDVLRAAQSGLTLLDLHPIVLWPYDVGGTATVFVSNPAATSAVQLDILFDPHGLGRYGLRSNELLASAAKDQEVPTLGEAAQVVYLWSKRVAKGEPDRLLAVAEQARKLDPYDLRKTANRISARKAHIRQITTGRPDVVRRRPVRPSHLIRLARRVTTPTGFWVHIEGTRGRLASTVAQRFGGFLIKAKASRYPPATIAAWIWHTTKVSPVRLRPGLFVSWGHNLPRFGPTPDLLTREEEVDPIARSIVLAMARRLTR